MMPTITVSDRLYQQLERRADGNDIEREVWRSLSAVRESQDVTPPAGE